MGHIYWSCCLNATSLSPLATAKALGLDIMRRKSPPWIDLFVMDLSTNGIPRTAQSMRRVCSSGNTAAKLARLACGRINGVRDSV